MYINAQVTIWEFTTSTDGDNRLHPFKWNVLELALWKLISKRLCGIKEVLFEIF